MLIIAGPGSGKTRTLTHRIAYLIATGRAQPSDILALTFTNKAAQEMKARIQRLVGTASKQLWMGTFHSTFARLLRSEAHRIGFTSNFSIYDTNDSKRMIKQIMDRFGIDRKEFTPRTIQQLISSAKNQLISPGEYSQKTISPVQQRAAFVYEPYETVLRHSNAMDFDDLLVKPIQLFTQHKDVLQKYQAVWKYVHIDEYQDTNRAQYVLAKLLVQQHQNFCVVGDDAQSIYAFRGADISNILSFQRDYPAANTVRLEQNYRSTQRIVRLADSIIEHNKNQLEKKLWTDNPEGERITILEASSDKEEAQKIEYTTRDLHISSGYGYDAMAVLYRTNAQSRSIEDASRRNSIPYRIIGGVSFYQRKEIKDVLAYLRLLVNPSDTASLRRVINYPTRGIGQKTEERLLAFAQAQNITFWDAVQRAGEANLGLRAENAVAAFVTLIEQHLDAMNRGTPPEEIVESLIEAAGIGLALKDEDARYENVMELVNAVAEFTSENPAQHTLSTFLQEVALLTEIYLANADQPAITLMTLHASKGLEFPVVFIAGMEEGLFPLAKAAQDPAELEEERRLFYVGATRAEERLYLSYAQSRFHYGQHEKTRPSRFLDELDESLLCTEAGRPIQTLHRSRRNGSVSDEIAVGSRVMHPSFDEGQVFSIEGEGSRAKAVIIFESVGRKVLLLKFARLELISPSDYA